MGTSYLIYTTTNGTWHKTSNGSIFQQFKTTMCKGCPVRENCTKAKRNGKIVQRRIYAQNIEANRQRIENNPATYKKRQAIVEHPYGTIKRQWGFSYIITKKYLHRASADVGLMMTAYNLRRIMNIIGIMQFKEYLKMSLTLLLTTLGLKYLNRKVLKGFFFQVIICKSIFKPALNRLYLSYKMNINGSF